ncbi:MAG: aldehyde ferredoxin oxidoreductase C-terminal domain-containing protein, partial [Bacillota bacterium]
DASARQVRGRVWPMPDPRGKGGVGLGSAVADPGADHLRAPHDTMFTEEGSYGLTTCSTLGLLDPLPARSLDHRKIRLYLYGQMWWDVLKCLGACFFCVAPRGLMPVSTVIDGVRSATGWDFSLWEAMKVADRAACMARAFNVREGFGPESDRLPSRLFEGSGDEGAGNTGICPEQLKQAIHLYYDMRGWDPGSGIPTSARLKELGIDWVSSALRED